VIDCDIHTGIPNAAALWPYLSDHWREYIRTSAFKGPVDTAYPPNAPTTRPPGRNGSPDLEAVRRAVLEPSSVAYGMVNCTYAVDSLHHPDTAAAMVAAVNDWLVAEWLDRSRVCAPPAWPVRSSLRSRACRRRRFAPCVMHSRF
jgi:hypothetical protein